MPYRFFLGFLLAAATLGSCSSEPDTRVPPPLPPSGPRAAGRSGLVEAVQLLLHRQDTVPRTGNRDHDFALLLALHHRAALRMARLELEQGQDSTLRAVAKLLRTNQQQHVQQLRLATARLDNPSPNYNPRNAKDAFVRRTAAALDTLLQPLGALRGNVDQDFAALLRAHHRAVGVLLQAEETLGRDAGMRQLARSIGAAQQPQVRLLRRWQATHPAAAR
jgi:uncharacterized protein (DUF305 family)